ncbi:MAG: phosphate ABC transporter permease subunit PstC [Chloroflexota bacterium]|nr:phosphate ABC transporter permease subunit PstC [Chloroflexota bacterium]
MGSQTDAGRDSTLKPASDDIFGKVRRVEADGRPVLDQRGRPGEDLLRYFLIFCAVLSIFTTLGIILVLGSESLQLFTNYGVNPIEFLTGTDWNAQSGRFGILALASATVKTSVIAMLVAVPLGLGAAIYLGEYAPSRLRSYLKPILELLAGIPTVVYGYFAVTFMTPLLRGILGPDTVQFYNNASPGIVIGIMIFPTIVSMSEDALSAVPRALREASYGLGATKFETIIKVVFPAALSGITASIIVGLSRAVGETMIVALASGAGPNYDWNPFVFAETMTAHIARISSGDLSYGSVDYNSVFAVGLTLFIATLGLNILSRWITNKFREIYE